MAVEEYETEFGTMRREVGPNEAALFFDPPAVEQMRLALDARTVWRRHVGDVLLDELDDETANPGKHRHGLVERVAHEEFADVGAVHNVWVWLNSSGQVVTGPDGRTVTARSLNPPQPD